MSDSIVTFFPVGEKNGGMILLRLNDANKTTMLVDVSISPELIADYCDVAQELRDRLPEDSEGRPYVDAFILTHRHQDHLQGIQDHFHLGAMSDYPESQGDAHPKIVIRELWSSYHFWKTASPNYELCEDAKAFNKEMRRRVENFKQSKTIQAEGERAIIIGKDPDGKCAGLELISYEVGQVFSKINARDISTKLKGLILGPLEKQANEEDDAFNDKNRQSIVINLSVKEGAYENRLLLAADAECLVWETLWSRHKNDKTVLEYDILQAPHHCSWHSLSYDSQSEDDDPKVCADARAALSQAKGGACVVSQSKPIKSGDDDPPSTAAKDVYLTIVPKERFYCTGEYPNESCPQPLEFKLLSSGVARQDEADETSAASLPERGSTGVSFFVVNWRRRPDWPMRVVHEFDLDARLSKQNGFSPYRFQYQSGSRRLDKYLTIRFAAPSFGADCDFYWQVTNTGDEARRAGDLRGGFQVDGNIHSETTKYAGDHCVQCFVVKNGCCIARSREFVVRIR